MVQIKHFVAFILGVAAIAPVVARPVGGVHKPAVPIDIPGQRQRPSRSSSLTVPQHRTPSSGTTNVAAESDHGLAITNNYYSWPSSPRPASHPASDHSSHQSPSPQSPLDHNHRVQEWAKNVQPEPRSPSMPKHPAMREFPPAKSSESPPELSKVNVQVGNGESKESHEPAQDHPRDQWLPEQLKSSTAPPEVAKHNAKATTSKNK